MTNYGTRHSMTRPAEIDITDTMVFVANNIVSHEIDIDDHMVTEYEYEFIGYEKNEYLSLQYERIAALEQELQATKILLGVE